MALNFDQPPVYDSSLNSAIWIAWYSGLYESLVSYLNQGGIILPNLDEVSRDSLKNNQNGQCIFNTDLALPQVWINGVWKTFTVT